MNDLSVHTYCTPNDFPNSEKDVAVSKAKVINHFIAMGSWKEVLSEGIVVRSTLWRYHQDQDFKDAIERYWPMVIAECEGTIAELMREGRQDIRLKAAQYLLEAHKSQVYDSGVRREKARASGNAATIAFAASLTPERIKELQQSSPFALAKKEAEKVIEDSKINPGSYLPDSSEEGG